MLGANIATIPLDLCVPHQHVLARDPNMIEPSESVVGLVLPKLQTDIPQLDPWERFMIVEGAKLHDEQMVSIVPPLD